MPRAPSTWWAARPAVTRGAVGEQLAPPRSRTPPGRRAAASAATPTSAACCAIVDEVLLHRLEGADRPSELDAARAHARSAIAYTPFERAGHQRDRVKRAAHAAAHRGRRRAAARAPTPVEHDRVARLAGEVRVRLDRDGRAVDARTTRPSHAGRRSASASRAHGTRCAVPLTRPSEARTPSRALPGATVTAPASRPGQPGERATPRAARSPQLR